MSLQGNEIYDLYIVAQPLRSTEICTAQSQIINFFLQGEGKDRQNTLAIHIERGDGRVYHLHLKHLATSKKDQGSLPPPPHIFIAKREKHWPY